MQYHNANCSISQREILVQLQIQTIIVVSSYRECFKIQLETCNKYHFTLLNGTLEL